MFGGFSFGEGYFGDVPPVYPAVTVTLVIAPRARTWYAADRRTAWQAAPRRTTYTAAERRTTWTPQEDR